MTNKLWKGLEEFGEWVGQHPGQLLIAWIILYPTLVVGLAWILSR